MTRYVMPGGIEWRSEASRAAREAALHAVRCALRLARTVSGEALVRELLAAAQRVLERAERGPPGGA